MRTSHSDIFKPNPAPPGSNKVDALKAGVRQQLAQIVRVRQLELAETKTLFEAKAVSADVVRTAEQALQDAKLRLAEER